MEIFRRKEKAKYQKAIQYIQWAFRELKGAGEVDGKKPSA